MKCVISKSKITMQTEGASARGYSGVQEAISITPPEYGVEFVDSGIVGSIQMKENTTGLSDKIKAGIENLSGTSMADRDSAWIRSAGQDVIQRFGLEGPWNIGHPVHEVLTLMTIKGALKEINDDQKDNVGVLLKSLEAGKLPDWASKTSHNLDPRGTPESFHQFLRGVIWADDPKGYLFDNKENVKNYSSGVMWLEEFDEDEKDEPEELIARSHFGDLQFFHGMAVAKGVKPSETLAKVLSWAEFLIEVATGRTTKDTLVKNVDSIKNLFPKHDTLSIRQLFVAHAKATATDVRQRAAGVLLHLIQDSYAKGHVQRDATTGAIEEFHSYGEQDEDKHKAADQWATSKGKDLRQIVEDTSGARDAIDKGVRVLVMLDQEKSTVEILKYLRDIVFLMSPQAANSGAGAEFKE